METVATLSTDGIAFSSTATVSVRSGWLAPTSNGPGCVQVTTWPTAPQAQLPPVRIFEYATGGEWDVSLFFPLPEGPSSLEWEMSPDEEKWMEALASRNGGAEKALAIINEYKSMIARSETQLVRERQRIIRGGGG